MTRSFRSDCASLVGALDLVCEESVVFDDKAAGWAATLQARAVLIWHLRMGQAPRAPRLFAQRLFNYELRCFGCVQACCLGFAL